MTLHVSKKLLYFILRKKENADGPKFIPAIQNIKTFVVTRVQQKPASLFRVFQSIWLLCCTQQASQNVVLDHFKHAKTTKRFWLLLQAATCIVGTRSWLFCGTNHCQWHDFSWPTSSLHINTQMVFQQSCHGDCWGQCN